MRWHWLLVVLICLSAAGCADGERRSDDNKFGGFYGGVNGGVVP